MIAPEGALVFHEKAWNAYPYCRTSKFTLKNTFQTWCLFTTVCLHDIMNMKGHSCMLSWPQLNVHFMDVIQLCVVLYAF